MTDHPARGEVWWVDLEPTVGSEANKVRPCVVVSSDGFVQHPIRLVMPLTTWQDRFSRHQNKVAIPASDGNGLDFDSAADALQLRAVSLARFQHRAGRLSEVEMEGVEEVIALVTGLAGGWSA